MNKFIRLTALLLFVAAVTNAQTDKLFSLSDCMDYAMKNQPKLKGARLDEQMTIQQNNEVIGIARPQIKANGQFQYLFVTPKQRAASDAFDFGSSLSFFKIDTPAYAAYMQQPKK